MKNANFKIDERKYVFLEQLVSTGSYKSLSEIYRIAIDEFMSKYTDIPTNLALDRRNKRNAGEINKIHEIERTQNRQIASILEELEELKRHISRD